MLPDPNTAEAGVPAPIRDHIAEQAAVPAPAPDPVGATPGDRLPPEPAPPAPEEAKAKQSTEYVLLYGIAEEADDAKAPRNFAVAGPPIEAPNTHEAKKQMMLVAPDGLRNAAGEGKLWLVAVPVRSFKNLKRVQPRARVEPQFDV